jgi:hypothetical protein
MKFLVIFYRYLLLVDLMTLILQQKVIDHYQVVVTLISLPRVLSAEWANTL